jgi:hypothetical protein
MDNYPLAAARRALDALPIEWDEGDNAKTSSASIAEWLKAGLDAEQATLMLIFYRCAWYQFAMASISASE